MAKLSNSFIWPGSNGNDGAFCIFKSSSIIGASWSDFLISYHGQPFTGSYPSTETQSVYSTAPADWATIWTAFKSHTQRKNAQKVSAPSTTLLPTTACTIPRLKLLRPRDICATKFYVPKHCKILFPPSKTIYRKKYKSDEKQTLLTENERG